MTINKLKIAIINYGIGNIKSLQNTIKNLDFTVDIITNPKFLKNYDKFFLPGVGSFKSAMELMNKLGWENEIKENVVNKKKFIFGICLGMQALLSCGREHGKTYGLNLIDGEVIHLKDFGCTLQIPHIGWNDISIKKDSLYFKKIPNNSDFYFINSYVANIKNNEDLLATTNYGVNFTSVILRENIFGTQFHPEKSSKAGRQLILNYLNA
jgi:glutamine amidotransferase